MKRILSTLSILGLLASGTAFAGEYSIVEKNPVSYSAAPPPVNYGVGPYWGLFGGVNLYQDWQNSDREQSFSRGGTTYRSKLDTDSAGGFGGIKFGYGFDGDVIKPAIEFDAFYNGFDIDGRISGGGDSARASGRFDSGAFLANINFRLDTGTAFMPYVGAGAGFYTGSTNDGRLRVNGRTFDIGADGTDFAWQAQAGFDYFINDRLALFTEYKFLNYEGFGSDVFGTSANRQHLLGIGFRMTF